MTLKALIGALIVASVLAISTTVQGGGSTPGWFMAGSHPTSYELGVAPGAGQNRGPAGFLKSREAVSGFGTMMQQFNAADYLGKRVRLSAAVRTENVQNWAGLWMRVDEPGRTGMAFDNMQDRPIKGTTGWTRHEVVLDVADSATLIALGVLISGPGTAWLDDVKFEIAPTAIPTTGHKVDKPVMRGPANLDFTAPVANTNPH
jgi:hypothetical protein